MGTYFESLEPQVRRAVPTIWEKGYQTAASGFFRGNWRALGLDNSAHMFYPDERGQVLDFRQPFSVSSEVRGQLAELGVETVEHHNFPGLVARIGFSTPTPDIAGMAAMWDSVADILPVTGGATPTIDPYVAATAFYANAMDLGIDAGLLASSPMAAGAAQLGGEIGSGGAAGAPPAGPVGG